MLRFVLAILLIFPFFLDRSALADRAVCSNVVGYFEELDLGMFSEMESLLEDDVWLRQFERSARKMEISDVGVMSLTQPELQPVLDYLAIPGNVLLDFPAADIPEEALAFHESALEYWLILPAYIQSVHRDGLIASGSMSEPLENAETSVEAGLVTLAESCPEVVQNLHMHADRFGEPWESLSVAAGTDDLTGYAFSLMVPAGIRGTANAQPSQIEKTPAVVDYSGLHVTNSPLVESMGTPTAQSDAGQLTSYTGVTVGNPDAPVTMHIFSDFQCHFCLQFQNETLPLIVEDFVRSGEVKLVFHDFPRLGTDPSIADSNNLEVELQDPNNESSLASQAALCAGEQDRYLEMSSIIFENYGGVQVGAFNRANLTQFANDIGLDTDTFDVCMNSSKYVPALAKSIEQGQAQGITAVPMFILDNGDGAPNVIQQTAEGYTLLKKQIQLSIDTAP